MPACVVKRCMSRQFRGSKKSFHRFPFKKPDLLKQWIANIDKEEAWYPSRNSIICSDHFEEKCFNRTGQRVKLKKWAIPTLFYIRNRQHMIVKKEASVPNMGLSPTAYLKEPVLACKPQIVIERLDPQPNLKEESVPPRTLPEDHTYNTSPNRLKRKLENEHNKNNILRKKLKIFKRRISKMQRKVLSMKDIINNLNDKRLISQAASEILQQNFSELPAHLS